MSLSSEAAGPLPAPSKTLPEYNPEERRILLQLAHDAILSDLEDREMPPLETNPHLSEPRGAFTTLYATGRIRGCVGYPAASLPLDRTILETARAAAFNDPRFLPVTLEEARRVLISISVLSPMTPIRAEEVEVGRYGLLISQGSRRGLLLPQVAAEHGWDRITFLEQTCRKAGLPLNAWRTGATVEAFTAEVFGDPGSEG